MSNYQYLDAQTNELGVCLLTITREEKLNALSADVLKDLKKFFENLACASKGNESEIKAVILTGAGEKSFVAGADIAGMSEMGVEQGCEFSQDGQDVTLLIEESKVPVIAAVNGFALGGGLELALSCDFIYASSNALFGLPEVSLGLIPGFGGTQRLSKIVGRNRAKELIYSANKINAEQARAYGLVLEIFEDKTALVEASHKLMEKILRNSPYAVGQAKTVVNRGVDLTTREGLAEEKKVFGAIFNSHDMKEGTKAFTEKRKPVFKGE